MFGATKRRSLRRCAFAATAALLGAVVTAMAANPSEAASAPQPITEETGRTVFAAVHDFGGLGLSFNRAKGTFTARVPRGVSNGGLLQSLGADAARVRIETSRFTAATLADTLEALAAPASAASMAAFSYGFYFDAAVDQIHVDTTAPESVFRAAYKGRVDGLAVATAETGGRASRQSDGSPHKGGASIMSGNSLCSSGFSVAKSGRRYMVTAGHCFANGAAVRDRSNSHAIGTVSGRTQFPAFDMELIGGSSYSRDIYTGGASGVPYPVESAADPSLTGSYCHSGQTTYEHCGDDPVSLESSFCDESGCTEDLVAYRGVTIQGRDSGSPFYAKFDDPDRIKIRGENIARNGSTSYAEKWSAVRSHLGVSIVTTPMP